jgi:hypothetical protein
VLWARLLTTRQVRRPPPLDRHRLSRPSPRLPVTASRARRAVRGPRGPGPRRVLNFRTRTRTLCPTSPDRVNWDTP